MFYLPSEYSDYKYLVSLSDNYVILSTSKAIYGESGDSDTVPCIYQYFTPSIYTIESSFTSEESFSFSDISSDVSSSIFNRADFPIIFICNFIICLIFVWVINQLSKLVYKGGIFGPN